jgi:hypothetical protein
MMNRNPHWVMQEHVSDSAGGGVPRVRENIDLACAKPGEGERGPHRVDGQRGRVLLARKPLFLDGEKDLTITKEGDRGVMTDESQAVVLEVGVSVGDSREA